jgi:DNA polymerase (family 10)
VIAAIHSGQRQDADTLLARYEAAMRNPLVDCIAHPSGRLLNRREASAVDMRRVIELAAETGTALEINANPRRLDLSLEHARMAADAGVAIAINSDAHRTRTLAIRRFGITHARAAGLAPEQILNTRGWDEIEAARKRHR